MITNNQDKKAWPLLQKVLFRFFFIYFMLYVLSWPMFGNKRKVIHFFSDIQNYIIDIAVHAFNSKVLHFRESLININNSDDTSFRFVQIVLYLVLALLGTVIWSLADRNKKSYYHANYYLKIFLRYFIALVSFLYGFVKVFAMQMEAPTLTEMATPLGELSAKRLAWIYVGYSPAYEIFLGLAEVLIGILLLYRRTVTLGLFVALGVYVNVMLININYDIAVKMFSINLVIMITYLLLHDAKRLADFFIFNKPVTPNLLYQSYIPSKKSRKIFRVALKTLFILYSFYYFVGFYKIRIKDNAQKAMQVKPIPYGRYAVSTFVKNGDTLPVLANDSLMWKDIVFERDEMYASINTADTMFLKRYERGIFYYEADTVNSKLICYKRSAKKGAPLFTVHYTLTDKEHVELRGKIKTDSVFLVLTRFKKDYRLSKNKFRWLVD